MQESSQGKGSEAALSEAGAGEELLRLFVAIALPHEIRRALSKLAENLKKGFSFTGCQPSWVSPETIHLTLRFLGPTPPSEIEALREEMTEIARRYSPVTLRARDLGVFPHWRRPRILWVGLHDKSGQLLPLQSELETMAVAHGCDPERNNFHPHLTLARFRSLKGIGAVKEVVTAHRSFRTSTFKGGEIVLFKSDLAPAGAKHTPLETIELGSKKGERTP